MNSKDCKNILVITKSPWDETNAFGNTLSNFFDEWDNVNFYNIYCREELPQNNVCCSYFNITEKQLIKNILSPNKIGRKFSNFDVYKKRQSQSYNNNIRREKKMLDFFKSNRSTIFLIAREVLWKFGSWKNKELDSFINENKIDIIFAAAADPIYLQNIIKYCKKKTNAKLILFFADDIYCHKTYLPLRYIYQSFLRHAIESSVKKAVKLYGASKKLCEEYELYFGKHIEPLHKGCSFDDCVVKKIVSYPIKMAYAGNLFYGRWEILKALAYEIERINTDDIKIILEIYTTTTISPEIDVALNRGHSSQIIGSLPYEQINKVLANADIVLHVESFDQEQIKTTRLSFSTKIIDCMQSGSCMIAIGPNNISSIQYLENAEGAVVISNLSELGKVLNDLVLNPDELIKKAIKLNNFARKYHDIKCVRHKLKSDFSGVVE